MILLRNIRKIENGVIVPASLLIENGTIRAVLRPDAEADGALIRDCGGLFASAGLIEQHAHGADGAEVMDCTEEAIDKVAGYHLRHGVTTFLPTTSTDSFGSIRRVIDASRAVSESRKDRQCIPGIHIEGQYISEARNGGMYMRYIKNPDPEEYIPLIAYADGWIRRWSIAPELPGALAFGDYCTAHGIVCSVAHSDATYDEIQRAMA
ncbi:MAG: amidohydrolase family protein, partial [Clostridia bacterium]|nr:amidohydrolase family protein [Clostridia bacterium]